MSAACTASLPEDVRAMQPLLRFFLWAYQIDETGYLSAIPGLVVCPSWWRIAQLSAARWLVGDTWRRSPQLAEHAGPDCPHELCDWCKESINPVGCCECTRRASGRYFDDGGRWSDEAEGDEYLDDGQALTAELQREEDGTESYEGEDIPW